LKGAAFSNRNGKNHIITSTIEHPAILATCEWLRGCGFEVTLLPVDKNGLIDPTTF